MIGVHSHLVVVLNLLRIRRCIKKLLGRLDYILFGDLGQVVIKHTWR